MTEMDDLHFEERSKVSLSNKKYKVVITVVVLLLLLVFVLAFFMFRNQTNQKDYDSNDVSKTNGTEIDSGYFENSTQNKHTTELQSDTIIENTDETYINPDKNSEAESQISEDQDPQSMENLQEKDPGTEIELSQILIAEGAAETKEQTVGIDVSKYQGNINWEEVASSGIDFAMIRVGYRTMETGTIKEDSSAKYNLQEATANGIKVGAYFFSTAITEEEAREEAQWTADFISRYKITYPVAYNCEGFENENSRQYSLTKEARTGIAKAFLDQIYSSGYTPMFYASKNELKEDAKWITSELEKIYKIWLSWYPSEPYPDTPDADYEGSYAMWQYTNNAILNGIDYPVDVNVAYFGYEGENTAKNEEAPDIVGVNIEAGHHFSETSERVTAKEATNLRDIPSQGEDSKVILTLQNGQIAERTGISNSGWSRVVYEGKTYYAVSSLLTTDLTPKTLTNEAANNNSTENGLKTDFTICAETVMPKIEVNLRNIPSVTDSESIVVATAKYGETFKRTGYNEELGWSRVEYNGQTLYCVSSYIYVYEAVSEE